MAISYFLVAKFWKKLTYTLSDHETETTGEIERDNWKDITGEIERDNWKDREI